jgi:DNA-binding NarL/FixJ family response regulator
MRVVLAGKHADVRSAVRLLVTWNLGMEVVGEIADAAALWTVIQDARPVLLWLARLHAAYPTLQIIVLSGHPEARQQAMAAGANAFVSTADSPEQMIKTLQAVCGYDETGSAADNRRTVAEDTDD